MQGYRVMRDDRPPVALPEELDSCKLLQRVELQESGIGVDLIGPDKCTSVLQ
jgi:hypothetical protein